MKTNLKLIAGLLGLLALCFLAAPNSQAQAVKYTLTTNSLMTNIWADIEGTNTCTNAYPRAVKLGDGVGLLATLGAVASTQATVITLGFDVSLDGTTYTTDQPFVFGLTANGVTKVVQYTNIPPTLTDKIRYIKLAKATCLSTGQIALTNLFLINKQ